MDEIEKKIEDEESAIYSVHGGFALVQKVKALRANGKLTFVLCIFYLS